jgi:hypothetical protein
MTAQLSMNGLQAYGRYRRHKSAQQQGAARFEPKSVHLAGILTHDAEAGSGHPERLNGIEVPPARFEANILQVPVTQALQLGVGIMPPQAQKRERNQF